jgi:hypothetical protein
LFEDFVINKVCKTLLRREKALNKMILLAFVQLCAYLSALIGKIKSIEPQRSQSASQRSTKDIFNSLVQVEGLRNYRLEELISDYFIKITIFALQTYGTPSLQPLPRLRLTGSVNRVAR